MCGNPRKILRWRPLYQWRNRLMEVGAKLFARDCEDKEAERLKAENRRLTQPSGN